MTTAKSYHGRISKGRNLRILKAAVFTQIVFFVLLVWIDRSSIFLLGSPAIPANWTSGDRAHMPWLQAFVYLVLAVIKRSPGDEQKIQRQKALRYPCARFAHLIPGGKPDASTSWRAGPSSTSSDTPRRGGRKEIPVHVRAREGARGALRTIAQLSESGAPARNEHSFRATGKNISCGGSRVAYLENGETISSPPASTSPSRRKRKQRSSSAKSDTGRSSRTSRALHIRALWISSRYSFTAQWSRSPATRAGLPLRLARMGRSYIRMMLRLS